MKKVVKQIALLCSAFLLASCVFTACTPTGDNGNGGTTGGGNQASEWTNGALAGFELPNDQGQADNENFYDYNSDLFYLNETRVSGADPGAIYVSHEDIVNSYEKYQLKYQYFDQSTGEYKWIASWSEDRFETEFGTLEYWQEAYGDYFYMITTGGNETTLTNNTPYDIGRYTMWRSHDLSDWDMCGPVGSSAVGLMSDDWTDCANAWAPEFIYDEDTGLWYIWSSMDSKNGYDNTNTYGPDYSTFDDGNSATTADQWDGMTVSCYVSETPLGPYRVATTKDIIEHQANKTEDGRVVLGAQTQITDITKTTLKPYHVSTAKIDVYEIYDRNGALIGYKSDLGIYYNLNGYEIANVNPVLNIAYYYPRMATDERKIQEFIDQFHITNVPGFANSEVDKCTWPAIDVNPVVDEHGNKYLYFSQHVSSLISGNHVWVVAMKDWLSPEWDTLTHIATPGVKYIVQDGSFSGQFGEFTDWSEGESRKKDENGNTISVSGGINEGTEVIYHDGRFYFTYSPFGYGSRKYSPYIGVSTDPLGREEPFVKLGEEWSPVIGIGNEYSDYMAGTGHHVFIKAGDELFILYHCFYNPVNNNDSSGNFLGRCIGADRAYWQYVDELGYDVLFGNGPSYNLQPKPETYTGYTNVGKYAEIKGNGDFGSTDYLIDGMVTAQPFSRQFEYGKKDGGLEIHYKWDEPVKIKALMVYNAGSPYEAFKSVTSVVFKLAMRPSWYNLSQYNGYCYIDGINCDDDDYIASNDVMRKASAAIAEFNEIVVEEMYVYISGEADNKYKTEYQSTYGENKEVHVSEIYIFGNKA